MPKLDGTETHKDLLTPFDAHEQVTRGTHTHGPDGYQPAKHEHREFPKAIDHDENGEPIIQTAPPRSSRPAEGKTKE